MFKSIRTKLATLAGSLLAGGAFAEGSTYTAPPGLSDAISTAQTTATGMAGDIVPAAVGVLFAFAGLVGIYLIWRIFRKAAGGR